MKHVTKLLRRLNNATEPFEGIIEEKHAFIKIPDGTWGNKILVNELVSLKLAEVLSINIPEGGVCIIDSDTNIDEIEEKLDYDETIEGVYFYSYKLDKSNPYVNSYNVVKHIVNKEDINKIILV